LRPPPLAFSGGGGNRTRVRFPRPDSVPAPVRRSRRGGRSLPQPPYSAPHVRHEVVAARRATRNSEPRDGAREHRNHARPVCASGYVGHSDRRRAYRLGCPELARPPRLGHRVPRAWRCRDPRVASEEGRTGPLPKGSGLAGTFVVQMRGRRRGADSNRCTGLCRPLPNHSATAPRRIHGTRPLPRIRRIDRREAEWMAAGRREPCPGVDAASFGWSPGPLPGLRFSPERETCAHG
jgi:hypothetical protein